MTFKLFLCTCQKDSNTLMGSSTMPDSTYSLESVAVHKKSELFGSVATIGWVGVASFKSKNFEFFDLNAVDILMLKVMKIREPVKELFVSYFSFS